MSITRIALVGHCGFDSGSLSRLASELAPNAELLRINDQAALDQAVNPQTLLWINRLLDGRFAVGNSGIDMIQQIASQPDPSPMMLVSNYEDAQQQAQAAGALPGFGKSHVADPQAKQRLADTIAAL